MAVSAARAHVSAAGARPVVLGGAVLFCACVCVFAPVHHLLLVFPTAQRSSGVLPPRP